MGRIFVVSMLNFVADFDIYSLCFFLNNQYKVCSMDNFKYKILLLLRSLAFQKGMFKTTDGCLFDHYFNLYSENNR